MGFHPSRLRRGEVLAGASAVVLLVLLLVVDWYHGDGRTAGSLTGWQALTDLRWLLLVAIALALGLVLAQAAMRAPAVPVTLSMFTMIFGIVSVVALAVRALISPPPHQQVGAYLGLLATLGVAVGGYLSFRQEGVAARDERTDIPVVRPDAEAGTQNLESEHA
jgi:hypothetical protein